MHQIHPFKGKLPPAQTYSFKDNLHVLSKTVYGTASGKRKNNVIIINQITTYRTEFNSEYAQICPFEGNLPPESAPVHSIASRKGGKCDHDHYESNYNFNAQS